MFIGIHVPHYFNKGLKSEVRELSIHSMFANFAMAMVTVFEPIFLYNILHFTVQEVLLFMAAVYACYILLIPLGARITSLFGFRKTIALSIPFQILFWLALWAGIHNIYYIFLAPLIFAVQKSLYWPGYHAVVTRYANDDQKGREFGALYAIINIANMLGPILGGFLAERYSPGAALLAASFIYCVSVIPLLAQQEIFVPKEYSYKLTLDLFRAYPKKALGYLGFGEELIALTIWPIFIFTIVQGYADTGKLTTIASLAAAIVALVIGKISDSYTKRVLVKLGALFAFLGWFLRFTATSFVSAFALDAFGRTAKSVVFIPLSTLTYLRAEATKILPYIVFFEQSLAIGKLLAALVGIAIFTVVGGGLMGFTSVFIVAALFSLLYMFV